MALHKSIAKQWQLPSWALIKVYNPTMGKAEYSAMTKGQDRNQKIAHLTALFIFMRNRRDNFLPPHLGPQVSPLNSCIFLLFAQICQGSHLKILIPASKQLSSLHSQSITPLTQENQNQRQQKRLQK